MHESINLHDTINIDQELNVKVIPGTSKDLFRPVRQKMVQTELVQAILRLASRVLDEGQVALLEDWMTSGSVRTCDHDVVTVIREIPKIIRTLRREILDDPVCQQLLDSPDSPFRFFEVNINDWLRAAVPLGRK